MQKRSLPKILIYSILTLGVYELLWLYQTRQELIKLSTVRIPSIRWLVILNALQFAGIILGITLALMIFRTNQSVPVSQACWSSYVLATAPESTGQTTLSDVCRQQVEQSLAVSNKQDKLIKGYLVVISLLVISRLGYPRWLRNYALAVQQVTAGKLSQTTTMFILSFAPACGMMVVQNIFNNIDTSASLHKDQPAMESTENKAIHRILSVIALGLAVIFGLFIVFLVAVNYYGSH